jgi:hypothetical protein
MATVLSLPFRITKYGEAATVVQGTDDYYGEQIATILSTIQGERSLEPFLGIPDIAFDGFQNSALQSQVATYLPELKNVEATINEFDNASETVTVAFKRGVGA